MTDSVADRLLAAVMPSREHTAIVVRAVYQPVGGAGRTVMPPTYPVNNGDRDPNARYLMDSRLVDGEQRRTVIIDQEPSQANRVEEALRDARDAGLVQLPVLELRVGSIRLTSLDFPHRTPMRMYGTAWWTGSGSTRARPGCGCGWRRRLMCGRCISGSRAR